MTYSYPAAKLPDNERQNMAVQALASYRGVVKLMRDLLGVRI